MPELPEVETIRKDLSVLEGKRIIGIPFMSVKTAPLGVVFFKKKITGRYIKEIKRRGKLLIFSLDKDLFFLIHLKMTGQLIYQDKNLRISGGHSLSQKDEISSIGGKLPNKYARAIFKLNDNSLLFFNDLRKFAYFKLVNKEELDKIIENGYGIEPLRPEFTLKSFTAIFANRKTNLKALLLNQKLIAGLGNIYVDESLFKAGVRPDRRADSLKKEEIYKLFKAINEIIAQAIKYRGTTFSDYTDASGHKGGFSTRLKVYGRKNEPCFICGQGIKKIKLAGRGTHYCSYCQK